MAFRLFWGGNTKGFLLSIGGFHPNYTPEEGMLVSDMKRMALKLEHLQLAVGLESGQHSAGMMVVKEFATQL